MFGQYIANDNSFTENLRTGAYFRVLGLHFQSNLDPFSFTKIAIEYNPFGLEFGEAYITWTKIFPGVGLTAGKFRQQFGVVNRWHVFGPRGFKSNWSIFRLGNAIYNCRCKLFNITNY